MKDIFYSTGEAARLLGIPAHRIVYALAGGRVREPQRLFGKRAFRCSDLVALAGHFGVSLPRPGLAKPGKEGHHV